MKVSRCNALIFERYFEYAKYLFCDLLRRFLYGDEMYNFMFKMYQEQQRNDMVYWMSEKVPLFDQAGP